MSNEQNIIKQSEMETGQDLNLRLSSAFRRPMHALTF